MKPSLSFVLQLPPSTAYAKLDAVAENLLSGVIRALDSGMMNFSLFMDGPTLETLCNVASPQKLNKIRKAIEEGNLELLGGGFYDAMLPLFPTELQAMQLEEHGRFLWKHFNVEPTGYFNSSMVWEMEMTDLLESHRFEYALVQEASLQDALGRTTPVSGWYSIEDKGAFLKIVPISQTLSRAIAEDDFRWQVIAEPYCRSGKTAVTALDIPPQPGDIIPFFERLIDFLETNELETKTMASVVNEQESEGRISFLLSAGQKIGLPATARTCRELLVKRPEVNLLHKTLLSLFHRAKDFLRGKELTEVYQMLLPAMSPIYYRDMQDCEGMRTPMVRWWGSRFLLQVANRLTELVSFDGIRLDIADFMLDGRKYIWTENHSYSFLLDYYGGGILRILNAKDPENNLLSSWRDDGEPDVGFLDFILPNAEQRAPKLDQVLSDREGILANPFDYQIKRHDAGTDIQLLSEQPVKIGEQCGFLLVEKKFALSATGSEFQLDYKFTNRESVELKGFFGTLIETGLLTCGTTDKDILVDGTPLKFNFRDPLIFPDAARIEIKDTVTECRILLDFGTRASLLIAPIFGASALAAPEALQGIRIFPFWKLSLEAHSGAGFRIAVHISKR